MKRHEIIKKLEELEEVQEFILKVLKDHKLIKTKKEEIGLNEKD